MGHGSGGKLMHDLIARTFLPSFDNPCCVRVTTPAVFISVRAVDLPSAPIRMSYTPLFFPGGDIGRLAVCGTVNDVAMLGAKPLYLTAGFILEEDLNSTCCNAC